jgi:hypothetical protein
VLHGEQGRPVLVSTMKQCAGPMDPSGSAAAGPNCCVYCRPVWNQCCICCGAADAAPSGHRWGARAGKITICDLYPECSPVTRQHRVGLHEDRGPTTKAAVLQPLQRMYGHGKGQGDKGPGRGSAFCAAIRRKHAEGETSGSDAVPGVTMSCCWGPGAGRHWKGPERGRSAAVVRLLQQRCSHGPMQGGQRQDTMPWEDRR